MNITTTYKTNAAGTGQILAKSGGKQKTVSYDQTKSSAWNHGTAAGAFLLAKDNDDPLLLAGENWTHDSNDSGTVHKFSL